MEPGISGIVCINDGMSSCGGKDAGYELSRLYVATYGGVPDILALPSAGSDRKYFRLSASGCPTVVGTWGENINENRSFVELARVFANEGMPVPAIYAESSDGMAYLQEDLGNESLLPLLSGETGISLAEESLRELVRLQTVDEEKWSGHVMSQAFSARQVMWDLNYFKYDFLKPCGILFDEEKLEDDFEKMSRALTSCHPSMMGFMYRDFQSRNIMICDDGVRFIDFQGGRKGPLLYDAVSFLWQAKARFSMDVRMSLLTKYADMLSEARGISVHEILKDFGLMALFRTLQVLGAYGFRGLVEKRAHFIESIPMALENLSALISMGETDGYPELKKVAEKVLKSRFACNEKGSENVLTVSVFSFSYKKGYPEDLTGNGGGFMFDCRGMHNPGRYEEYRSLTGLDSPVRKFLEDCGEVQDFVGNAVKIVSPSIDRYSKRGFRNLQVGFGCTGGRHRSVYCAESFARFISSMFPDVRVRLEHREQGLVQIYNKTRI